MSSDPQPGDPFAPAPPDRSFAAAGSDRPFTPAAPDPWAAPDPSARDALATRPPDDRTTAVPVGGTTSSVPADPFDRPATGPVGAPTARSRSSGSGMLVNVLLGIAVVVAVGGVAFAVGRATSPATVAATSGR